MRVRCAPHVPFDIDLNTASATGTGRVGDDTRRTDQARGHASTGREFSRTGKTAVFRLSLMGIDMTLGGGSAVDRLIY